MPSITKAVAFLSANLFVQSTVAWSLAPYATFCNDDNCSEGCGMPVAVDNPGCLNQFGRRSVKLTGSYRSSHSLVASPEPGCNCQNYCESMITNVMDLGYPEDENGRSVLARLEA